MWKQNILEKYSAFSFNEASLCDIEKELKNLNIKNAT